MLILGFGFFFDATKWTLVEQASVDMIETHITV